MKSWPITLEKPSIYTPTRFREYVEVLEICGEHLRNPSQATIRVTIILLDNLAEVLMYQKCGSILRRDQEGRKLFKEPHYGNTYSRKVLRDFKTKINLLAARENRMSATDAAILRIGHSYRNRLFHRDEHNPRSNAIIARQLFASVCSLLRSVYSRRLSVGGCIPDLGWLEYYGLEASKLDFHRTARVVTEQLGAGLELTLEETAGALSYDLLKRLCAIGELLEEDFMKHSNLSLNTALRLEEFEEQWEEDDSTAEYWQAWYSFARADSKIDHDHFSELHASYNEKRLAAMKVFEPSVTLEDAMRVKEAIPKLSEYSSIAVLLERYQQLDKTLSKLENLLYAIAVRLSEAADIAFEMTREEAYERRLEASRAEDKQEEAT